MKALSVKTNGGYTTLFMSVIILVAITLISLHTVKPISLENKISNNEGRSNVAFHAAEAGMASAFAYLAVDPDVDGDDVVDAVIDTDGDGVGDSDELEVGEARATVTVEDASGGQMVSFNISSLGVSDDNSASRTITQIVTHVDPIPNHPDNPLTTRGALVINGSATVYNPEGHSTIWSGDDVDLGSNNATATEVASPADPGYPTCMETSMTCGTVSSSNKLLAGLDIIEHDSSLGALSAEEMFINFFGLPPANFRDSMVTIDTDPANVNADADLAKSEVIWVEGDASLDGLTVGCASRVTGNNMCSNKDTKPSVLVVNGNATMTSTPQFYGIVFVMGNVNISGNSTVHGALIVAGNMQSSTGGSLDVWYNSSILSGTRRAGPLTGSPGTWRDF